MQYVYCSALAPITTARRFQVPYLSSFDTILYSQEVSFRIQWVVMLNEFWLVTRLSVYSAIRICYATLPYIGGNFRLVNNHNSPAYEDGTDSEFRNVGN